MRLLDLRREKSRRDSLTHWFNRRHGVDMLRAELRRAKRNGTVVSLIRFDLDHFKTLNDRYGHQAGDAMLMSISRRVGDLLRAGDVKCRYGGDEFMVILPETPSMGAQQAAEHIRRAISSLHVTAGTAMLSVTTSIGLTTSSAGELDPHALIACADAALHAAKRAGRNTVVIERHEPVEAIRTPPNVLSFAQ